MTISNDNSQAVHDYITNELVNDPELKIEKEEDLLLAGLLDSVSVVRLVSLWTITSKHACRLLNWRHSKCLEPEILFKLICDQKHTSIS